MQSLREIAMKIQCLSSSYRIWCTAGAAWWLPILLFVVPWGACAKQQGVITLMPKETVTDLAKCPELTISANAQEEPTCSILLRFKTSVFPVGAKIIEAHLSLVAKMPPPKELIQSIRVYKLLYEAGLTSTSIDIFAAIDIDDKVTRADWRANEEFSENADLINGFSLRLESRSPSRSVQWHSSNSETSRYRPRLTLKYTLENRPVRTQSDSLPAGRSPRNFLPKKNPSRQNFYVARRVTSKKIFSFRPAFYNDMIYTLTEEKGGKYLQALSPLGNLVWSVQVNNNPGQHVAISDSGRLYIVGNQRIIVYQLNLEKPHQPPPTPLFDEPSPNLNPLIPPTVGANGSLYFVNLIQVYGLNPDSQELWKVTLEDHKTSPLTLGPSGEFVYLTTQKEGLITINAQTGEKVANTLPNQPTLQDIDDPTLHAPVVIRHSDGTEKIYVAANSANNGKLACFDNIKEKNSAPKITPCEGEWKTLTGLYTQLSVDFSQPDPKKNKYLYTINVSSGANRQGILKAIDWLSGDSSFVDKQPKFDEINSSFIKTGNLATDQDGNIVMWNGVQSTLYVFNRAFETVTSAKINDIPSEIQLFFGTDGTLYAYDVNGRVLWAVLPHYTLSRNTQSTISHSTINHSTISHSTITSPTHLHMSGAAEVVNRGASPGWVFQAGGSVILSNGFAVKKGAILTIETNSFEK